MPRLSQVVTRIACIAGLIPTLSATVVAQESIDLSPSFAGKDKDYLEWIREGRVANGESPLGPARTSDVYQLRGVIRISRAAGAGRREVLTFDRLTLKSESRRGPMVHDSDVPAEYRQKSRLGAVVNPTLGKRLVIAIDERGQPTSVLGMDDISMAIEEEAAGQFVFEPMMADFTDDAAMHDWGHARFAPYANKPVKVGDKWETRIIEQHLGMGTLLHDYQCSLVGVETIDGRTVARVSYTGTITQPEGSKPGYRIFNTATMFKSGEFSGTALYDIERGEFTEQTTETKMATEASMLLNSVDQPHTFSQDYQLTTTLRMMSLAERKAQREANVREARIAFEKAAAERAAQQEASAAEEQGAKKDQE